MAIASLHTISVLGDSPRQVPRQILDEGNNRTQASSVLQMWRKIEDVHTGSGVEQRTKALRQRSDEFNDDMSTQTSESNYSEQRAYFEEIDESIGCSSLPEGQSGMKVGGRDVHEKSPAIGDSERKRVRKIFQDWMNCGGSGHSSNSHQMSGSSRAQWLGDNECERVRVVREWVQLTAQDRGSYSDRKAVTEIGAQIEMVRDGLVLNQNEGRPNRVRRKIRRLCGKQALLDLLVKAEKERESELQDLTKHHAVSQFPHRNRIQSLLKSRFLRIRNNMSSEKQKTRSTAAGELGLLRQRHTVSDLREGFLSRTDSSGQSQLVGNFHTSSSSDASATGTIESKTGTKEEITGKIHEQNDSANEQSVFLVVSEQTRHASSGSPTLVNEQALHDDEVNAQQSAGGELIISSPGTVAEEILQENTSNKRSQHHGGHDGEMSSQIEVVIDLSCDPSESINQGRDFRGSSACVNDSGVSMVEDLNLQGHATEDEAMHGQHSDNEDGRMDRVAYIDWRNTINNDMGNNGIMGNVDGLSMDASENEMDDSALSEGHDMWDASESEDSVEEWLQGSSRQTSGAFASLDTFNGSEDDIRTSELNELVGRRRVSNLLESGFRENLNRVLQTYVERQAQASVSWDLNDSTSSPVSEVLHQEQQTENHNGHSVDTFGPYNRSRGPPPHTHREHIWDQIAWTHNMHQPVGFDWEVINELRLDITTLQLRMNDMQRMLEACMDMQLELQRSIRQEVSAALNRSASPESADTGLADDKSRWELVRKGICCVCGQSNIDSLLYRCGHMCTCTKCANRLFEEKSKCPMCRSPIVEVIRAYSIQQQ
uniref:RING-type domain-containing protein n=1 Tax=Kalanchoe fedtschenkoi TaxID=63787 RepID=A0A7N0TLF9_KALFE